MIELKIQLSEKQKLFRKEISEKRFVGYGGAKGGGKSHGLRNIWLLETLSKPGITSAIFRRSYPELEDNHIGPLFKQFPQLRPYYNGSKHELRIPQLESELKFRYCKKDSDVDIHQGQEYHRLGIEEASQWTEQMIWRLLGSNRSSRDKIRPVAGFTFNPGGIAHKFLKRFFVEKKLKEHELAAGFKTSDIAFIQALVTDNPALMKNNPDYVKILEAEPNEMLRRAYRYGDWNIAAGQYFTEFNPSVHVIKPFKIPRHWKWFGSYDYGFNHPACVHWWATDEDGTVYLVNEMVAAQMGLEEQAKRMNDFTGKLELPSDVIYEAGHDCWARKRGSDPTIAEDFIRKGILLRRANIDRKLGAHQVRMYLSQPVNSNGEKSQPRVYIFDTCEITIDCILRMTHNPDDPEDVLKVDAVEGDPYTGDDPYDCFRYGLMSRPAIAVAPKKSRGTNYNSESVNRPSWQTA